MTIEVDRPDIAKVSILVPVYNESETIQLFLDRISNVFKDEDTVELEILFVNDGSTDDTLNRLLQAQKKDARVRIIDLSRNFGKEAALTAGLQSVRGDACVPIDVDLQDPPELIVDMIASWRKGNDVVLAKRVNRDTDTWSKRVSATWFYRIHNWMADPNIPENVGDFRLMDFAVVNALNQFPETRRFMKGLFAWVGFKTEVIDYVRPPRVAGSGKFNGWRLWNLALEGLTSFGTAPLRIWTYIGGGVALASFLYGMFIIFRVLFYGVDVAGYASLFVVITFLGGLQLLGVGIIGEYLGRTYIEAKRRPIFVVRRVFEPVDD